MPWDSEDNDRQRKSDASGHYKPQQKSGSGLFAVIAIILGLAFISLPIAFFEYMPGGPTQILLIGFGALLFLMGGIVLTITRLYLKTSANEAFVRTGMGGEKIIINGGTLVIPVVHNIVRVSLETMRLDVERAERSALITKDSLRVNVVAEFYIKVDKQEDRVKAAATSLGGRAFSAESIKVLVMEKLVSALRTVAAMQDLDELHTKRQEFAEAVQRIVATELLPNGLTLESVTISSLDQASLDVTRPDSNIFDAAGFKKITQIIENQRVERTAIKTKADKEVKEQEVDRNKYIYEKEEERVKAEQTQNVNIENAKAKAEEEATRYRIEEEEKTGVREATKVQSIQTAKVQAEQAVRVAEVEKAKVVETADAQAQKAIETAGVEKQKTVEAAIVEKEKTVEMAKEEKGIAVAEKQAAKALANAKRFEEEAKAKAEEEKIETAAVVEQANREKQKEIISKQSKAEQQRIEEHMSADVEKYKKITDAEAQEESAKKLAESIRVQAEAQKDKAIKESEGMLAKEMVPVKVKKEEVSVFDARVAVERKDLAQKAEFDSIAKELTIQIRQIEASEKIGIETAKAIGIGLSAAEMQIFGDQTTVEKIFGAFTSGQQISSAVSGFLSNDSGANILGTLTALAEKLGVKLPGQKTGKTTKEVVVDREEEVKKTED